MPSSCATPYLQESIDISSVCLETACRHDIPFQLTVPLVLATKEILDRIPQCSIVTERLLGRCCYQQVARRLTFRVVEHQAVLALRKSLRCFAAMFQNTELRRRH